MVASGASLARSLPRNRMWRTLQVSFVEITACVDVGTVQFMYRLMGHNLAAHGFDVAIIAYSYYPYGSAASQADDVARAVVWYTHTIRRRRRCSVCVAS